MVDDGDIAGPDDVVGLREADDPWSRRCEVLALLLTIGVLGYELSWLMRIAAIEQSMKDVHPRLPWTYLVTTGSGAGDIVAAGLLAAALLLVMLSPGDVVGRLGGRVIGAVTVLAAIVAAMGCVISVGGFLSRRQESTFFVQGTTPRDYAASFWLDRVAFSVRYLPAAALALAVAWFGWRAMRELPYLDELDDAHEG